MPEYRCPCDTCGKPVEDGDMVYSIANKMDDDGNRISARHWECHVPMEERLGQMRSTLDKATLQASRMGLDIGRPKPRRTP